MPGLTHRHKNCTRQTSECADQLLLQAIDNFFYFVLIKYLVENKLQNRHAFWAHLSHLIYTKTTLEFTLNVGKSDIRVHCTLTHPSLFYLEFEFFDCKWFKFSYNCSGPERTTTSARWTRLARSAARCRRSSGGRWRWRGSTLRSWQTSTRNRWHN